MCLTSTKDWWGRIASLLFHQSLKRNQQRGSCGSPVESSPCEEFKEFTRMTLSLKVDLSNGRRLSQFQPTFCPLLMYLAIRRPLSTLSEKLVTFLEALKIANCSYLCVLFWGYNVSIRFGLQRGIIQALLSVILITSWKCHLVHSLTLLLKVHRTLYAQPHSTQAIINKTIP